MKLNIDFLAYIEVETVGEQIDFQDSLLNTPGACKPEGAEAQYWEVSKLALQAGLLVLKLRALYDQIVDFNEGRFDDTEEVLGGSDSSDPYEELRRRVVGGSFYKGLPANIEQYSELLDYVQSARARRVEEDMRHINLPETYRCFRTVDQSGRLEIVALQHRTEEREIELSAKQALFDIETEHCLDNYNAWYQEMMRAIDERRPFAEMLALFK
ncbi:hypothetical protein GCM10027275_30760 [Rhabdobacter roseus]|uniref:Uncharacterized protein n=1 Tax=Rhabdobacter roseus TaxID=1655419 RepID=A0A840TQ55_9BACT|nr:hypothetical protein [Rhabdobacter roseus]MBB5285035.1 hypothetical protein [Rhabdobacter roseus]